MAREKPFSYNETHPSLAKFYKIIHSVSQEHIGKCVVLWIYKVYTRYIQSKVKFLVIVPKHLAQKQHCTPLKEQQTQSQAWRWQHHPNELCLQLKEVWVMVAVYIKPSKSVSSSTQTLSLQTETWSCQEIATLGTVTSIYSTSIKTWLHQKHIEV